MTPRQAFGEALREVRTSTERPGGRALSQERLALDAGLHRTHVSFLERGLKSPSLETIFILSRVLKVSPGELMERTQNKVTDWPEKDSS